MSFKYQIFQLLIILWITFLFGDKLYSQSKIINLNTLQQTQKEDLKPIFYFIHTDWCGYCKSMLKTTFKNKNVDNLLQSKVHFVKINAEEKSPIIFNNTTYYYQPQGYKVGRHSILEALGIPMGTSNFPIILIKNEKNETLFSYSGFLNSQEIIQILDLL